jgi:hypothetical protein
VQRYLGEYPIPYVLSDGFVLFLSFSYPVGNCAAAIRRTMLPKSRRVKWLDNAPE